MADENKKDFNAMLHDSKGMPKFQTVTDPATVKKYGGSRMYFAPPIDYDAVMKKYRTGGLSPSGRYAIILQSVPARILPTR